MIISPPFLLASGLTARDASKPDPMMDLIDQFEIGHHGAWPVTLDRRPHCAIHLHSGTQGAGQAEPVRAIADGEVVAYRVCKNAISDGTTDSTTGQLVLNSNAGFVLLRHKTDTGDGRTITFYSLYMHLLDMTSQEGIVPQPLLKDVPETGSANALPKWLLDTGAGKDGMVQPGGSKKVYRKDMLGYVGKYQGVAHLHFEIFMADGDFTAWFDKVQIGVKKPAQPTSGDYWGHSYFIIPGPQEFYPQPARIDEKWFPRVPGGSLGAGDTLYVEAWFNKGRRFTRAWIEKGGSGKVTLLTPDPIADPYDSKTDSHDRPKRYEYDLYDRAMALYPDCPSDGYEMLRFGRILSDHPTLTGAACATWIAVPLDENGTLGYVNIASDAIKKLSDADFPFFTGWQKVDGDNTPFNDAGRCDYAALCGLTGIQDSLPAAQPLEADPNNNNAVDLQLASYVQNTDGVDEKLRGMVFKARSEWDPSNNEERYKDLNDPYGFFGKQKDTNTDGYTKFTEFLSKFHFLDKTPLAGQQLWFFHPLAFIRHFRRCGWLSLREQMQLLPRNSMLDAGGHISWAVSKKRFTEGNNDARGRSPSGIGNALNHMFLKYGFSSSLRKAHFLGQIFKETGALCSTSENGNPEYFRKMYESYTASDAAYDFDNKYNWLNNLGFLKNRDRSTYIAQRPGEVHKKAVAGENVQSGDGPRFCGRGLIHLTWRKGYREYGMYRAKDFITDPNPTLLQSDAEAAADSAGYFWVKTRINVKADHGSSDTDVKNCFRLIGGAGGLPARQQFFRYAYFILGDAPHVPTDSALERQNELG